MTSPTEDFRVENSFSPQPGPSGLQRKIPLDTSPDKCPICLDGFENMAYLDLCFHRFCFRCVQEWSKNKAECPLCKQPFHSIFHSVRAEDDFKEYVLRPTQNDSFSNPGGQRFRYRTTMTRDRGASFRRPHGNGVLLERLSIPPRDRNNDIQHILRQFVARLQAEARSLPQIQEQEVIRFRRSLYRRGMRVQSVEDGGRFRDISSEFFRRNPACLHRLVPWLKRELTVLFGAHGSLVNIVQHIIMSNVTRYDLESQAFIDELKPFLLNRTGHFLHEFISFARSPFNIEAYDLHANYEEPALPYEEGSQSDSSVIMISPDEAETQELNPNEPTTTVTQAPWDDETPGPSYSTAKNVHTTTSSSFDSSDSSDEGPVRVKTKSYVGGESSQDSSEDCVIVGYVKPLAERTPELVELSSDSSDSSFDEKINVVRKRGAVPFQSDSNSDASSCSNETQSVVSKDESIVKYHKSDTPPSDQKVTSKKKDKESASSSPRNGESSSAIKYQKGPVSVRYRKRERSSDSHSQDSRHGRGKRGRSKHRRKSDKHVRRRRSSSSRSKSKRLKKRMRNRERSLSRKSKRVFPSREGRSRSRSRGHNKRRSRSRDYDHYSFKDAYGNRYHSRTWVRAGSESSSGRRASSRANYPRQHFSSEFSTQSFFEGRIHARNENHHSEDRSHHHERQRSRSSSNTRSRHPSVGSERVRVEKPGGKRKYKTRHLEDYHETSGPIQEDSLSDEENCFQRPSSKLENYRNEIGLSENPASIEKRGERIRKRPRSLSVEIIYEGATNTICPPKKKKEKKKHIGNSSHSSPSVITIYIDSDMDPEERENTRCGNNTSWVGKNQLSEKQADFLSPAVGPHENKVVPTLLADANIRAECGIAIRNNGFDNATEPLGDLPLRETSND
ncbi:E3 ubiquitin-protein ligase Topors [Ornithorhynchus anatinus]|uniref:E3 ubiquitin-protein ligase Topors n=1 Tax=Ornithorhynchus anatinus TaxID=9258 RepID=UPI0001555691|nr:E3 ubiquitin-protein ligase Topors [Ornithorhynchus anatinus]XP_028910714.1 E3 ubiquitin-protein ligase Topors [Ornithorhynchus anatinus]